VGITQAIIKICEKRNEVSCSESLNEYEETGGKRMDEE
jgi:hypothetical protein